MSDDKITIISQTTQERRDEIRHLFEDIKPYLDDGYGYNSALIQIGRITKKSRIYQQRWFRDLKEYGASQGYDYLSYSGKGRK